MYKVYASALAEKLREKLEGKEVIPNNQTDFRRGMRTMDNLYVLIYVVGRQLKRNGGKLAEFFVDLKATSDIVDNEGFGGSKMRERERDKGGVGG